MSIKRIQRRLTRLLSVLVALAILFCFGLYAYRLFFGYEYDATLAAKELAAGVKADENITNIALFGLDARPGDAQSHADCTMIVTVDNTRGKIKLTSLMRDSLIAIDGYGMDKLNAAYWRGGPSLAIRTLNENFGTDITEYVAVGFEQLAAIIDALDGVEIDVAPNELDELGRVIRDYGIEQGRTFVGVDSAGLQTLDGVQAMCYGRIRKGVGDDWARVERQSVVLEAMFAKVQQKDAIGLLVLTQKLVPYVTTSLSVSEIASLILGAVQHGTPALEHIRLPLDGDWYYSGPSNTYIEFDTDAVAAQLHRYIYDDQHPAAPAAPTDDELATGAPLGGLDLDAPPTAPMTADDDAAPVDPASLAEEGGRYDPETGDYYDSDGDRYFLNEAGTRVYY